jgi:hypothetical protein
MSRAHTSRFAVRDRGLRRIRVVTVWAVAGSAGAAVAAAVALVPSVASTAATSPVTGGTSTNTTPAGEPSTRVPGDTAGRSRGPAATHRPRPGLTTSAPRIEPPATPPTTADGGQQHTASGGS